MMLLHMLLSAYSLFAIESGCPDKTPIIFPGERLYARQICQAARAEGLDPSLVMAVVAQESQFEWWAISSSGARGLMQIMPETAIGKPGIPGACNDLFAPGQDLRTVNPNIRCGTRYFAYQMRACRGDIVCALAAYNQGPGRTRAAGGLPVTAEAMAYVPKVLGYASRYSEAYAQTVHPPSIRATAGSSLIDGSFLDSLLSDLSSPPSFLRSALIACAFFVLGAMIFSSIRFMLFRARSLSR